MNRVKHGGQLDPSRECIGSEWQQMPRATWSPKPPLSRSALGAVSVCLWVMACSPADQDSNSNAGGEAGMASGARSGVAGTSSDSNGAAGLSALGGSVAITAGAGGTAGAGTGGSISGAAGAAGGGTSNGGGMNAGGAAGSGGADMGKVPPVPLDPALMSRCTGSNPIKCTVLVPANGNYNVTVELGSAQVASNSQVEAELYRIVVPSVKLAAGAYSQQTFSANVRAEDHDSYDAPGKELDILIDGEAPALHGLGYAAANIPTLFVVGDSTVCDWDPAFAAQGLGPQERGWAQELSQHMKPGLAVANYADSGDTAASLYGKFASRGAVLKAGDYLFIQFGHNDQKSQIDIDGYKANLMRFISDARKAKATPILFSPVARKSATLANPGFAGLDQQARELAQSENIPFVDLTKLAIDYYATLDASMLFTSTTEGTHFGIEGATAVSKVVADALKAGTMPATSLGDFLK